MELVYFNEELCRRAPGFMESLLIKYEDRWARISDLETALERGETVTIRPATAFENEYVEELIALYEVWEELALRRQLLFAQISAWSDEVDPVTVADRLAGLQEVA
jgi:hypothetical protein